MQQLSELDASFLYLETDRTPMHIGGLYIFDASDREDDFSFAEFLEYIESRLHVAKFFGSDWSKFPSNSIIPTG